MSGETYDSELLESLVTPGRRFPDVSAALADLEAATNWEEAEANGRVVPREVRKVVRFVRYGMSARGIDISIVCQGLTVV